MAVTIPRDAVAFDEIDSEYVTFLGDNSTIVYSATTAGGSSAVGLAVTLSADNTVALAADGNAIVGKLALVESDGKCSVQVEGYMTLPGGNGATLTRGAAVVGALNASSAKGYVRAAASATAAELLVARGYIINNGDTANVGIIF